MSMPGVNAHRADCEPDVIGLTRPLLEMIYLTFSTEVQSVFDIECFVFFALGRLPQVEAHIPTCYGICENVISIILHQSF